MKIEDYTISVKHLYANRYECLVTHVENKITHGIIISGNAAPPHEWVYNVWEANHKEFFIDVACEIIIDEPIVTVLIPEVSGSLVP